MIVCTVAAVECPKLQEALQVTSLALTSIGKYNIALLLTERSFDTCLL